MVSAQTIADNPDHYSVADDLELIDEIGSRDVSAFLLSMGRAPDWWVGWTDQHELPFYKPLRAAIERKKKRDAERSSTGASQQETQSTSGQQGTVGTRERDSLLKLVIGMAVKGYAFDPKATRSKAATEIRSDLEQLGLSLSDDTIRKYLREGADLLPPQEPE